MRSTRAAAAALLLTALLVIPPWALIRFIGNPWPAEGISLAAPFTDGAIIGLLAVAVWVLWGQLVMCVVVETVAALSADRIVLPAPLTLGVQQQLARRLVTTIIVAAVSTPVATGTAAAPAAGHQAPTGHGTRTSIAEHTQQHHDRLGGRSHPEGSGRHEPSRGGGTGGAGRTPAETEAAPVDREQATVTVMRLDTLMGIAARVLGDEDRWQDIADLNEGRVMNDATVFRSADYIRPGWELLIPTPGTSAGETGRGSRHVVVEAGDTLSAIALDRLGEADRYPEIFRASRGITQPGGEHLVDPDHIEPGWVVRLPGPREGTDPRHHEPDRDDRDTASGRPDQDPPPDANPGESEAPPTRRPAQEATPAPVPGADSERAAVPAPTEAVSRGADEQPEEQQAAEGGVTALRALLAGAACLAAGALGLVAVNRRRQFRRRRIGRTIASTPPELAEVEQAILEHGHSSQEDVRFLDRALRHVAACCRAAGHPVPQLGAAVLGAEDLTLLFTRPAAGRVPEGWTATGDARAWMLPRGTFLEEDLETQPAPYPALVSIGQDEAGRTWLLDLETPGVCGIGGAPEQVADLARFLVAELAVNAWSEGSEVLLADQFGCETIGLNPARLRQVERGDALARAAVLTSEMGVVEQNLGADVLTRRRDGLLLDTANPVVIVVPSRPEEGFVAALEDRERSRVVLVHGEAEESPTVELAADGTAFLPMWGISVRAFALPPAEAEAMAALLASTRNVEDQPMPPPSSEVGPLGRYARVDGSLREEFTEPRHPQGNDPSSLLPEADEWYLATAATTPEDMAAVAPSVPEPARAEIEALDPGLDQDLADWFEESSPRPKVRLLGPVDVTARSGGDPATVINLAGTISFIAYLACQERGVTGERAAEACGWTTQRTVQNRATNARFLLGTRPDGGDWLPDASTSDGARRGTPTYQLVRGKGGVLVDIDLFVRLRFRAQKRGDEGGEQDLVTALSLVGGAPFEAATDRRFPWLFKGQRHDDIMVAAIHDVAHVLATRAVADGRTDLARLACEAARRANPHSDVAWLDLAAATEADSGPGAADALVRERVADGVDEDLPPRTEAVLDRRHWLTG